MYGMLQPVFCNALYSVLRRFVQWRFARPRYFCKVLMHEIKKRKESRRGFWLSFLFLKETFEVE